jgi:hypothetical protein
MRKLAMWLFGRENVNPKPKERIKLTSLRERRKEKSRLDSDAHP